MPRVNFYIDRARLADVESEITPGARRLQAIGGGRYVPGRATAATIAIALGYDMLLRVIAAQKENDELSIVTEDNAVYRLLKPVVDDNVLRAELEFLEVLEVAPRPS
jgi:hypothetical protein